MIECLLCVYSRQEQVQQHEFKIILHVMYTEIGGGGDMGQPKL